MKKSSKQSYMFTKSDHKTMKMNEKHFDKTQKIKEDKKNLIMVKNILETTQIME